VVFRAFQFHPVGLHLNLRRAHVVQHFLSRSLVKYARTFSPALFFVAASFAAASASSRRFFSASPSAFASRNSGSSAPRPEPI
jgi:hypothetical protein